MLSDTKFEKITLYTATQKLGTKHPTSALDYILSCLDNNMEAECKIIESDSEEYALTPARWLVQRAEDAIKLANQE